MKKYYIGLLVLALVSLGLASYTFVLGAAAKQDKQTDKKSQQIAQTLNDYIAENNEIPADLAAAGVSDAPATIKYERLSEERYKFCVTYKSASTNLPVNNVSGLLLGAAFSPMSGDGAFDTSYGSSAYEPQSLYPSYNHTEGENCTTVKPYLTNSSLFENSSNFQSSLCDETSEYYSFYKDYCENGTFNALQTQEN